MKGLKNLYSQITGFKSSCIFVLYTFYIGVVILCTITFFGMLILGGLNKDFIVSGDLVKDYCIAVITGVSAFCITGVSTVLGATVVETKTETKAENKESEI